MPSIKWLNFKTFDFCLFSCFGIGKFPWGPGTIASIVSAIVLYLVFQCTSSTLLLIVITCLIFFISYYRMKSTSNFVTVCTDPGWIVIDEFLGISLGMTILSYQGLLNSTSLIWFVIFFRFFDITKVYPASYFDKKKGAFPLIADDLVSALYAVLCTYIIY